MAVAYKIDRNLNLIDSKEKKFMRLQNKLNCPEIGDVTCANCNEAPESWPGIE